MRKAGIRRLKAEEEKRRPPAVPAAGDGVVPGRGAVLELLKSGAPVEKLFIQSGEPEGSLRLIRGMAAGAGIPTVRAEKDKLDALSGGVHHQGVVAITSGKEFCSLEDLLQIAQSRGEPPFLLLLDGIEDPGNLGALIRCAEGAGVHGVVLPKRRCAPVTAAVYKASAGALSHMAVCRVPGIPAAIDRLKKEGFWVFGADMSGDSYRSLDWTGPVALVMGAEGRGLSRLTLEKCDFLASIPMYGKVASFNVACAAAVLLCEAAAKRHA